MTEIDQSIPLETSDIQLNKISNEKFQQKGVAKIKPEYLLASFKDPESLKRSAEQADLENDHSDKKRRKKGQNKDRAKVNSLGIKRNTDSKEFIEFTKDEMNRISPQLKFSLRKKEYDYTKANEIEKHVSSFIQQRFQKSDPKKFTLSYLEPKKDSNVDIENTEELKESNRDNYVETKYKPKEIKKIDFNEKLIVAPLTTVGNLPFRRICKEFGADITVSEMAVVTNILKGEVQELALLKRHKTEDIFGIQLAGAHPNQMIQFAQFATEQLEVSFIDINCGCPIDVICNKGMGSGLMAKSSKLEGIVRGMKEILDIPLTVKIRMGLLDKKPIAMKLIPKLATWGADAVILHGRSKQQRYTREADWEYISQCVDVANSIPIIGNGDTLSYTEYNDHISNHKVNSVMIGRGCLIKPWLLTEIKEQRHWDITATERFDILKRFVNYGLDHYGGDDYGAEQTRRFLLEWLSFLHRYIPIGLLEKGVPQHINERPPPFKGRNELETLMASGNVNDWIEITRRLIPKEIPENFTFVPKHKSNSYDVEG